MSHRYQNESPRSIAELKVALEAAVIEVARLAELGALPRSLEPLRYLAPHGGERASVDLRTRAENDRPREPFADDARAEDWVERGGELRVVFGGPAAPARRQETSAAAAFERRQDLRASGHGLRRRDEPEPRPAIPVAVHDHVAHDDEMLDLVLELDRIERERRMPYIVLKWFRDTALPHSGLRWADDPDFRRDVLRDAIDSGMVVTAKVSNPHNPQFPPTTLRVNREHERVQRALARDGADAAVESPRAGDEPAGATAAVTNLEQSSDLAPHADALRPDTVRPDSQAGD